MNYRQIIARKKAAESRWLKLNPNIPNSSGIYILTRVDEQGIKYAYVGQAKHLLNRLGDHLLGYQHIDLSLKKHKLWNEANPYGWEMSYVKCEINMLDTLERELIKKYADEGYQLRNKTSGGQDDQKAALDTGKTPRGYYDGVDVGYRKASKEVKTYFEKYLDYSIKGKPNKVKERKYEEFGEFLKGDNNGSNK